MRMAVVIVLAAGYNAYFRLGLVQELIAARAGRAVVPDLEHVAFYIRAVLDKLLFGLRGHVACEEKACVAVIKAQNQTVIIYVFVIRKRAEKLKFRVAEAVLYALLGNLERKLRALDCIDKVQICRRVARVGRGEHGVNIEAFNDRVKTAAVVCVTVGADNIVELFYAEIADVFNDRVSGRGNACVDEHVLPVAAQKLRVALTDVDVVDIQTVHRHGDGRIVIRHALKKQYRDCDNYESYCGKGIFFRKPGKPVNITFFDFPADHCGGLDAAVESFDVDTVFTSPYAGDAASYLRFVETVESAQLTLEVPDAGARYRLGDAEFEFIGPLSDHKDVNDDSLVMRLTYGDTSFLFTGDMTAKAEKELIADGADVKCDVLKVGHHGSSGSSCYQFLYEAEPKLAVISCGRDNDYGHPHEETLSRLRDAGVTVYRTDELGSIVIFSDGMTVERRAA